MIEERDRNHAAKINGCRKQNDAITALCADNIIIIADADIATI